MDDATPPPSGATAPVLAARLSHIRGMLGVLQTVKQTKKQARPGCTRRLRKLAAKRGVLS
jgi:hypothetical protein